MRKGILAGLVALAATAPAHAASLPTVKSGPRPGPDVLYEPAAVAPQLENAGPWTAPPILISGASAYRDGQFLYQDFLYDSHGAAGAKDPSDPFTSDAYTFSPKAGTLTYPSDPVYGNDAADLVEFRVMPLQNRGGTAFRITLNTLEDPERTAFTVAIGSSDASRAWPFAAGVRSPAQYFLTVHGTKAELRDAGTDKVVAPAPTATVDLARRQITAVIPNAVWNPVDTVRMVAGVGLWDTAAGEYLAPGASRTETAPGGAAANGARLFNLAFRGTEPLPDLASIPAGVTIADAAAGAAYLGTWWREKAQSDALASGDVSAFHADVDFKKLILAEDDESDVPKTGPMNRILASHRSFGQGIDYAAQCGGLQAAISAYKPCTGPLLGQLQPYALYVPKKPAPAKGYGFTLLMHSLSANYNQYTNSKNQSQLGERGAGSLVATPAGRGPDGFYRDIAEADSFEVWADVARLYKLDPGLSAATGYSMGGLGTFHMLSRWPDLFARGFAVVGAGDPDEDLASLHNTPIMMWNATADELVNANTYETSVRELTRLGLRFTSYVFLAADHLTLATNDEYGPGVEFLGTHRVNRNPARVVYTIDPETNSPRAGAVADHAYWLSGLTVKPGAARGTIDVRSEGFGRGDAPVGEVENGTGQLEGGSRGPTPYASQTLEWGKAPAAPVADRLVVKATDVATAVVDARRARVSCHPAVDLSAAPGLDLRVACAPLRTCRKRVTLKLPRVRGRRIKGVVVRKGRRKVRFVRRGRAIVVRRSSRAARLRIRVRYSGGRVITIRRKLRAC